MHFLRRRLWLYSVGAVVSAPTPTPTPFSPDQLANLELWIDARDLSGADLSAVSLWNDRTVNVRNLSQGTAARQPKLLTTSTTSPLGTQLVRWSGANPGTVMQTSILTTANFPTSARGYTVYAWAKWNVTLNDFNISTCLRTINDGNWESGVQDSSAAHRPYVRTNSGGGAVRTYNSQVTPFTGTLTWVYAAPNDGTGLASIFKQGTSLAPIGSQLWAVTGSQTGNLLLGATDSSGTRSILADIGAVLWYSDSHDAATRAFVEGYLTGVFG
jgi:hypothetical protein